MTPKERRKNFHWLSNYSSHDNHWNVGSQMDGIIQYHMHPLILYSQHFCSCLSCFWILCLFSHGERLSLLRGIFNVRSLIHFNGIPHHYFLSYICHAFFFFVSLSHLPLHGLDFFYSMHFLFHECAILKVVHILSSLLAVTILKLSTHIFELIFSVKYEDSDLYLHSKEDRNITGRPLLSPTHLSCRVVFPDYFHNYAPMHLQWSLTFTHLFL